MFISIAVVQNISIQDCHVSRNDMESSVLYASHENHMTSHLYKTITWLSHVLNQPDKRILCGHVSMQCWRTCTIWARQEGSPSWPPFSPGKRIGKSQSKFVFCDIRVMYICTLINKSNTQWLRWVRHVCHSWVPTCPFILLLVFEIVHPNSILRLWRLFI